MITRYTIQKTVEDAFNHESMTITDDRFLKSAEWHNYVARVQFNDPAAFEQSVFALWKEIWRRNPTLELVIERETKRWGTWRNGALQPSTYCHDQALVRVRRVPSEEARAWKITRHEDDDLLIQP